GSALFIGAVHDWRAGGVMQVGAGRRSGPTAMSWASVGAIAMSMAAALSSSSQPMATSATSATQAAARSLLAIQRPRAEVSASGHADVPLDGDGPAHARNVVAGCAAGGHQLLSGLAIDGGELRAVHEPDDRVGASVGAGRGNGRIVGMAAASDGRAPLDGGE